MIERNSIKESGILEQYVMGELSREERAQVDAILREDTNLRGYVRDIENDLEQVAFENAITPPAELKHAVLQKIHKVDAPPKVVTLSKKKRSPWLAVAASLAVLFALGTAWLYQQWQETQGALQLVQQETRELTDKLITLQEDLTIARSNYEKINGPNIVPLFLKGNEKLPEMRAITYINHKEKTVLLNTQELPQLPTGKTYQMWADVEGEMINMGVVSLEKGLLPMKYIDHAESLNLTIEPAGGSDHPTVAQLVSNVLL